MVLSALKSCGWVVVVVELDCSVSTGPFLECELIIGPGPGPGLELDNYFIPVAEQKQTAKSARGNGNKNPEMMDKNMDPGMANVCRKM